MMRKAIDNDCPGAVRRYVWHPVTVATPTVTPAALAGRSVAILGGGPNIRGAVAAALEAAGARTVLVETPDPSTTIEALAAAVAEELRRAAPIDVLLDLNLDDATPTEALGSWRAAFTQTVAAVQSVYDDWAAEGDARRCGYLAVTRLGGRMGYDGNGIAQPLGGIWAGFAKSLPHELPACRIKVLDLPRQDAQTLADLIALELSVFDYYEVGWRDGVRTTLACRNEPVPPPRLRLGPGDVVLLSGGARGIGFQLAASLASAHGCRVIVTGRRPLPDPQEPWLAMDDDEFADLPAHNGSCRQSEQILVPHDAETPCWPRIAKSHPTSPTHAAAVSPSPTRSATCAYPLRCSGSLTDSASASAWSSTMPESPHRLDCATKASTSCSTSSEASSTGSSTSPKHCADATLSCSAMSDRRPAGWAGWSARSTTPRRTRHSPDSDSGPTPNTSMPVSTLAWTTWDRIGLIANFDAALRYGTALPVDEGIAKWSAELLAAQTGGGDVPRQGRDRAGAVPARGLPASSPTILTTTGWTPCTTSSAKSKSTANSAASAATSLREPSTRGPTWSPSPAGRHFR